VGASRSFERCSALPQFDLAILKYAPRFFYMKILVRILTRINIIYVINAAQGSVVHA
jgi:hypothetical protein